jgi:hypothetical protein
MCKELNHFCRWAHGICYSCGKNDLLQLKSHDIINSPPLNRKLTLHPYPSFILSCRVTKPKTYTVFETITMNVCWRTKYTSTLIYLFLPVLAKLLARGTSIRCITTNSGTGCFCFKVQKHQAFRILRSEIKVFFLKIIVFWDIAPYSLVEVYRRFRGVYFILTTVRT